MLCVDAIKRSAHRDAWYANEDEPANYNPFQKIHSRKSRRSTINDVERNANGRPRRGNTNGSLPVLSSSAQRSPPSDDNLVHPKHASSLPVGSTSALHPAPYSPDLTLSPEATKEFGGDRHETSEDSNATSETVVPRDVQEPVTEGQPRKRKMGGLFGKLKRHKEEDTEGDDEPKEKQKFTPWSQIRATIFNSYINVLLIAAPVGIALSQVKSVNPVVVFVVNFIAIIPLAAMLSFATEEIALRTGETIGGLLNATFG